MTSIIKTESCVFSFFSFKFVLVLEVCVHNMKRWIIRTFNIAIHL